MFYNLSITQQIQRIFNNNQFLDNPRSSNLNTLKGIEDGNIYKRLLDSKDGKWIKLKQAYTFLINTDGIAISEKSNLTIWPVYLVINELPYEKRYCIDNVIVASMLLL